MINLKDLLANKTAKKTITEQPIGAYARYVKDELGVLTQLIQNGALNKITDSSKLMQIQTMLKQVQNAIADAAGPAITSADSDSNNNGFPDKTEQNPELERDIRGYGQGNYQGD